ncbi:Uncharacterized protein OBRU01_23551 [Operophtera brumata]|uniref:Uncharacterized protein n=1 Tax=Operophtera brumata TaxID=104452 RepID=A0A0L7KNJ1_OPEBR|nr:Uncharacterized protein OBRU01_23551 [Operophtera brumata]
MSKEARGGTLAITRSATNCERTNVQPELVFDAVATGECQDQTNSQPVNVKTKPTVNQCFEYHSISSYIF